MTGTTHPRPGTDAAAENGLPPCCNSILYGGGQRMPFRPENIMTTLLLTAVVSLALMGVVGAVVVLVWGGQQSTPAAIAVTGFVLIAMKVVLGMLQAEVARRQVTAAVEQVNQKADRNARKAEQVAAVVQSSADVIVSEVAETKEKVAELARHTNGELTSVVEKVAEKVREAEHDQALSAALNSEQFAKLVGVIVRQTAETLGVLQRDPASRTRETDHRSGEGS